MAGHATTTGSDERIVLGEGARPLVFAGVVTAVIGLVLSLLLGHSSATGFEAFYFAYLTAFTFFLSIALGALFFVLMQHLCAAGWSVGIRRLAEAMMRMIPLLWILSIPLLWTVAVQNGRLYRWAVPISTASPLSLRAAALGEPEEALSDAPGEAVAQEHAGSHAQRASNERTGTREQDANAERAGLDSVTLQKRLHGIRWLNPGFFIFRVLFYFAIWTWMAAWYRGRSVEQDRTGDPNLTRRMQARAGFCILVYGLTLTGAAGDLFMSLDPHWYSTMWGVYYFAGCTLVSFAVLILTARLLQRAGYLRHTVSVEHYHDLGKYLFGFTFFWGYIAFSQYMLLWYANIPEEIQWYSRHGVTTVTENINGWSWVILAILFGQLLIPFGGLLSRHVKRRVAVLTAWAVWVLIFHFVDCMWIVMPEYPGHFSGLTLALVLIATVGMGGLMLAAVLQGMIGRNLRPTADPRLAVSLAFENF